jgi:RNA recognition motif-containing protein
MGRKLCVGNLAYGVNDSDLQQLFGQFGTVASAQLVMDRNTGHSKGFGHVEMGSDQEAQAAITGLNGKENAGRIRTLNEARPKEGGARWLQRWRLRRRRRARRLRRPTLLILEVSQRPHLSGQTGTPCFRPCRAGSFCSGGEPRKASP